MRGLMHGASAVAVALTALSTIDCGERAVQLPAVPNPEACSSGVVVTGMKLRWEKLNHRISLWGIEPETSGCGAGGRNLDASYVGGDWTTGETGSDRAHFEVSAGYVEAPGSIGFHPVEVAFRLSGPYWEGRETLEVDLNKARMNGFDRYVVLVHGLRLSSDVPQDDPEYPMPGDGGAGYSPRYGWTTRGIALGAENVRRSGDVLFFDAKVRFAIGPSDRANMNEAMPHASVGAMALFQVVGLAGASVEESTVSYRLKYPAPEPFYMDDGQVQPHAGLEKRTFSAATPKTGMQSITGAAAWSWDLNPEGKNGYYIRELSWFLRPVSYDASSGRTTLDADGYASHTSILMFDAMDHIFTIKAVTISMPAGKITPVAASGTFEAGSTSALLESQ